MYIEFWSSSLSYGKWTHQWMVPLSCLPSLVCSPPWQTCFPPSCFFMFLSCQSRCQPFFDLLVGLLFCPSRPIHSHPSSDLPPQFIHTGNVECPQSSSCYHDRSAHDIDRSDIQRF